MCNALVCLAVWMCYGARTTIDKIFAIVPPVAAFVAAGFEHSIANIYFIPMALFIKAGAPDSFWTSIGKTRGRFSGSDMGAISWSATCCRSRSATSSAARSWSPRSIGSSICAGKWIDVRGNRTRLDDRIVKSKQIPRSVRLALDYHSPLTLEKKERLMRTKILAALATVAFVAALSVPEPADARFAGGGFRGGGFSGGGFRGGGFGGGFRGGAVGFRGGIGGFRGGFAGSRLGTWAVPGRAGAADAGPVPAGAADVGPALGWRGGYGDTAMDTVAGGDTLAGRRGGRPRLRCRVCTIRTATILYSYSGDYPSAYSSGCTCGY